MQKLLILFLFTFLFNQAEITNIQALQRTDGSKIVDISYEITEDLLFESFDIVLEVSIDGGYSFFPIEHATGDIGFGCEAGLNNIIWNFGLQFDNFFSDQVIYKITGTSNTIVLDDQEIPFEMVNIPAGLYMAGIDINLFAADNGGSWSTPEQLQQYWGGESHLENIEYDYEIMKYPVTNAEYAQFLISALEQDYISINSDGPFGLVMGNYFGNDFDQTSYTYIDLMISKIRWDGNTFSVLEGFGNHPATGVNFFGAWGFATYYGLELPSDAEWIKAARGINEYSVPWGTIDEDYQEYAHFYNIGGMAEDKPWNNTTAPVGSYDGQLLRTPRFTEVSVGQPCIESGENIQLIDCNNNCSYDINQFEWAGFEFGWNMGQSYCNNQLDCAEFGYYYGMCENTDLSCEDLGFVADCNGQCIGFDAVTMCLYQDGLCADGDWNDWNPECSGVNFNCEEYNYDLGDCGNRNNRNDFQTSDSGSPYGIYDLYGNGLEWTKEIGYYSNSILVKGRDNLSISQPYIGTISWKGMVRPNLFNQNFIETIENNGSFESNNFDIVRTSFRCVRKINE